MILVFDLDGTLIDSLGDLAAAASELATNLGGRALTREEVSVMVGDGAGTLVRRALTAAGVNADTPSALTQFLGIYERRLLDTTRTYDGVEEALSLAWRRARMSVLTNKPLRPTDTILESLGLSHYFDVVIGGDSPYGRKPDPAGLQMLTGGSHKALMIGDSPVDWQTAAAAGCAFAWARYGFGAERFNGAAPETAYILDKPSDLTAILDRFVAVTTGA
ncbi:MAG TPA: HAD-IA family hydrolase [Vicinamibacterales bacterium]|nr:HAD-IA family hydrolase [Vicinamibacterales bacterium]